MLKEYDVVRLKHAVKGIPVGTVGTIVHTFPQEPSVFWVEFPDAQIGEEDGVIEVWEKDLEAEGLQTSTVFQLSYAISDAIGTFYAWKPIGTMTTQSDDFGKK